MKKYAIIVAGGSGVRMGAEIPKQFLLLKGKPLLQYTLQSFLSAYNDLNIILVLPQAHIEKGQEIIKTMNAGERIQITSGGETRFQSVKNGLSNITHPSVVFVHDGVRCMVSQQLIQNCYDQAVAKGSAVPAVAATDSIRIDEGAYHYTIDRSKVRIIQTPQTFRSEILAEAFNQEYNETFTDEATVVEAAGNKVFLIEGDYNNLKITRPIDLCIAEKLLESFIS
ncbi:2-C-methyl-D-erythritol 4-phosphate cytidylyltransferase [Segetibacter koreensis]|uniref:2-C-methyl-D-erythritol 4-phosphate cytidylyltransferase n=1 Tax=Segetibacter koreensis TaxID=398037 RepID=UPI00035E7B89|nr:2-C-methyl-D-erythritol 4-phosphate cytidylyltransferase [Segetibacter koreensis]